MNPFGSTRQISGDLKTYLKRCNLLDKLTEKDLLAQWESIVGSTIAKEVELVDSEEGVLLLKTKSSAWKSEILMQKSSIVKKTNQVMGTRQFKDLRFIA